MFLMFLFIAISETRFSAYTESTVYETGTTQDESIVSHTMSIERIHRPSLLFRHHWDFLIHD